MNRLTSGIIPTEKILINKSELAQRLCVHPDFEHTVIDRCISQFSEAAEYRYVYTCVPVEMVSENICNIGFGNIQSRDLYRLLKDRKTALILAVTTGIAVDRLLRRLSVVSPSQHFITDAIGSAAAESLCSYMDGILRGDNEKKPRFSPGYGDLSLGIQPELLNMLNASHTAGISLNRALLMTPVKSITSIMGVYDE